MRFKSQIKRDNNRETYLLTFPSDLAADRVMAWLRSVIGTLPKRTSSSLSVETIVFETWATSKGIKWRLMIPKAAAEYIAAQLRTHGRGITVTLDDTREELNWTEGIELGMSSPTRQLRIADASDVAAGVLGSLQTLRGDEVVMIQWLVTPANLKQKPSADGDARSAEFNLRNSVRGIPTALSDELQDRRQKLDEPNLLAVGRIVTRAESSRRAKELVLRVESALSAASSAANYFKIEDDRIRKVGPRANEAATPLLFPAQLNLSELTSVIAWRIGDMFVAGLPQGATRHLYATEDVPSEGRILGDSNYPGHERPIALGYDYAVQHMYIGGATGTGKSSLMANCFAQDVANGYGAIIVDASNSESTETMFQRAMNLIPRERMNDVIVVNVADDLDRPVGFNILDQGNPRIVADQVKDLFAHLYQDTSAVWTKQLLFHGIYTLAERKGMTLVDLMPLLTRQTPEEIAFADDLIASVKDKELQDFWKRWRAFKDTERTQFTQPLLNRIWQLVSRPEARNIIGQSESSFQISDVLAQNKILLVSLSGLPADTASILGTLMVNAIWTAAQRQRPDKPNFLYLDEFQVMTKLPTGLDDMLNRARKHGLGVVMATQYLQDVPAELKNAVINNARTRVIFRSSAQEAKIWKPEFGTSLEVEDFQNINEYEAVAQIASSGRANPVTLKSRPPIRPLGLAREVRNLSRDKYGRDIRSIEAQVEERRGVVKPEGTSKATIGVRPWEG